MAESADIIRYLYQTYALWTPPNELLEWTSQNVMSLAKPIFSFLTPLQAGSSDEDESYVSSLATAKKEIEAETSANPIVVYTYDLSPFSSETKGLLKNLNLPYENISLGKEWIPGLLSNASKRAALLEMTGQSSLPHVFVGGKPIGGLFSGNPGILSLLKEKKFISMCQKAIDDSKK
jgi:glutaredoxin